MWIKYFLHWYSFVVFESQDSKSFFSFKYISLLLIFLVIHKYLNSQKQHMLAQILLNILTETAEFSYKKLKMIFELAPSVIIMWNSEQPKLSISVSFKPAWICVNNDCDLAQFPLRDVPFTPSLVVIGSTADLSSDQLA